ncbi:TlpA disulfide reductase family protein [Novosphingobium sp. FSW06-99]|uniref:TlpA family protein disulfide reductase n=1 Tax=Novosphingobium sp. FSW06-99 TaxID=1739113 RepID=UPI001E5C3428|nr:TlpA disulfide reductase family protein [Novosphingobium sp. FSW06-99]
MSLRLPLVVALAGLCLSACDREPRAPAQPPSTAATDSAAADAGEGFVGKIDRSHKGSAMPQATLSDGSGAKLAIQSLKGKPVLINLWATWCGPCVKELPTLDALAARESGHLTVVTASQDMGQPGKVATALAAHSSGHLHPWLDPDNTLGFFYNSGELPTSVLYDAQGREVWRMVGAHDWTGPDSQSLIAPAMP